MDQSPDRLMNLDSITSDYNDNTQHVGIINRNIQSWRTSFEGEGKAINVTGDMANCAHGVAKASEIMQRKTLPESRHRSKLHLPVGRLEPLTSAPYTSVIIACSDRDHPTRVTDAYVKITPDETGLTNNGFLACVKSHDVPRQYQVRRSHIVGMDMDDSDRRYLLEQKCQPDEFVKVPVVQKLDATEHSDHDWTKSASAFKRAFLLSDQFLGLEDEIRNANDCCPLICWAFWHYADPDKSPKTHLTMAYMHGREFMTIDVQQSVPPPGGKNSKARRTWARKRVAQRKLHTIAGTVPTWCMFSLTTVIYLQLSFLKNMFTDSSLLSRCRFSLRMLISSTTAHPLSCPCMCP